MQTRDSSECSTIEYVRYQRARRKDAEPIIREPNHGYRLCVFLE